MQSNTVIVDNSSYINNFMKFFIPFCLIQFKTICFHYNHLPFYHLFILNAFDFLGTFTL